VNVPTPLSVVLRERLDAAQGGARQTAVAVERLIAHYRGRTPTDSPVLRDRADVAAYAAYRMPATFEAVRAALGALRARTGEWSPKTHVDIGGGTGAATWAVADAWPEGEHTTTVLDWSQPALDLGRSLAAGVIPQAEWHRQPIGADLAVPPSDLVTISYVLGELTESDRELVVATAARAAHTVLVVEPGTPDGYRRILRARQQLIDEGLTVVAPCPHNGECPVRDPDWCHFAARVNRSSLHRQVKGGSLPYEDEKFSYVAATRDPVPPAESRVVRHPQIRKGLVLLDLCTRDEGLRRTTVSKRHGDLYREARDAEWGDAWPPPLVTPGR
jgi:ribosomal protein RSM22 (predicted rRNA methylase)